MSYGIDRMASHGNKTYTAQDAGKYITFQLHKYAFQIPPWGPRMHHVTSISVYLHEWTFLTSQRGTSLFVQFHSDRGKVTEATPLNLTIKYISFVFTNQM